jgi:two-component system response regulator HydG
MQLGAADLVLASDGAVGLRHAMMRLLERRQLATELRLLESSEPEPGPFPHLVGRGAAIQGLRANLLRAADSSATVLITGETGTGKELVARALHDASPRRHRAFVAIACSAIPPSLLEAELFGHRKGAFTGADQDRVGLFSRADGGTLFLDQMSDMPLDLQATLLRAIQERRIRPIGGRSELPFDARVVAATRRDLASQVAQGTFREDLYFRLKVIELKLTPLREMREDLLRLAQHFIRRASRPERPVLGLTVAAARALLRYDWPGNVRELEHCMTAAVALARHDRLCATDLPEHVTRADLQADAVTRVEPLKVVEERHVRQVLDSVAGNKARAARILGLDRKTLQRKVAAYAQRPVAPPRRRVDSSPG